MEAEAEDRTVWTFLPIWSPQSQLQRKSAEIYSRIYGLPPWPVDQHVGWQNMATTLWAYARLPFYLGSSLVALAGGGLYYYQKWAVYLLHLTSLC